MKLLSNIEMFVYVVEHGSFSATARHFGVTPSAISRQVSQLEEELGARLFHRTTRQQSLTEAGKIYYQYALRISADLDTARLAVNQLSTSPKGVLRVTVEKDFAQTFVQPILKEFLRRYPDIQLVLTLGAELVDIVEGGIDLAIRVGHLEDSSLVVRPLMNSYSVVCGSPSYFQQHGIPVLPSDLQKHNCLPFKPSSQQTVWRFLRRGDVIEIPVSGNFGVSSLSLLRDAALDGVGLVFIPQWFVQTEIDNGYLQVLDFESLVMPVHAVFANHRYLAPKIRAFIDFLVDHIPQKYLDIR